MIQHLQALAKEDTGYICPYNEGEGWTHDDEEEDKEKSWRGVGAVFGTAWEAEESAQGPWQLRSELKGWEPVRLVLAPREFEQWCLWGVLEEK